MEEYGAWLQSECTRMAIRAIEELIEEIKEVVTNGSLLQEKDTSKISLDFTLALGQIEGLRMAVDTIKDVKSIIEESEESNGN